MKLWMSALLVALSLLFGHSAEAQSNNCQQYLNYGAVLTAGQWQFCFSQKADYNPAYIAPVGSNPTATAGPVAVNGVALTFMRSDAAPAVQLGSPTQFGIMECDNVTVTCPSGVLTAITSSASSITVGTTNIVGGTSPYLLYDNAGKLGAEAFTSLDIVASQMPALTGDVTSSAGSVATTLATVNSSPGTTTCSTVTTNGKGLVTSNVAGACGGGSSVQPAGRLTLLSGTPIQTADEIAKGTIYYDCYLGGHYVNVFNGTSDVALLIGSCEISVALEASGTGEELASGVFDVWAINVSGTLTLCVATNGSGGGWASDTSGSNTARGTGYSQVDTTTRAYVTNKNALTHCYNGTTDHGSVAANEATYIGSFYTTANGLTGVALHPSASAGGSANIIGVFNAYNRVPATAIERDSTSSWPNTTNSWHAADGNNNNRISWVDGLQQLAIKGCYSVLAQDNSGAVSGINAETGILFDATSGTPGVIAGVAANNSDNVNAGLAGIPIYPTGATTSACDAEYPVLGFHYMQAAENSGVGITAEYFGNGLMALAWDGQF